MKVTTEQIKRLINQIDHDIFHQNTSDKVDKKQLNEHIGRMLDSIQTMLNVKKSKAISKNEEKDSTSNEEPLKIKSKKHHERTIDKAKVISKRALPQYFPPPNQGQEREK